MGIWTKRAIAGATAAVIGLTTLAIEPAEAARRHRGGQAAALAAVGMMFGTIAAVAAADARRDRWERRHYYQPYAAYPHYGPRYYAPQHYAPRPHWRGHRHWGHRHWR